MAGKGEEEIRGEQKKEGKKRKCKGGEEKKKSDLFASSFSFLSERFFFVHAKAALVCSRNQ